MVRAQAYPVITIPPDYSSTLAVKMMRVKISCPSAVQIFALLFCPLDDYLSPEGIKVSFLFAKLFSLQIVILLYTQ